MRDQAISSWLAAPFEAPYAPTRSFFLRRGLYLLLAFDAWLVMVEHGGRYGAGGFNVAHFAWVDALVPLPTPALYVGLLLTSGLMALAMGLGPAATRLQKLSLFGVYTASWLISLHDSYQHHYLLSWLLLWSVFCYEPRLEELARSSQQTARAPSVGLTLSAYTCAIVYVFTAVSKSSSEWRKGSVLARLAHGQTQKSGETGSLERTAGLLSELTGWSLTEVWQALSVSLVSMQVVIALGYFVSPGRDVVASSRFRAVQCTFALLAALSFHLGAEWAGVLQIGWFSYYMLWIGIVVLGPERWLSVLARMLVRPLSLFAMWLPERLLVLCGAIGASAVLGLLVIVGAQLDLPGSCGACLAFGFFGGSSQVYARGAAAKCGGSAAAFLSCVALLLAVSLAPVRFDFYRRWAGEVERLGQLDLALSLYRKAERYAPRGQSRASRIQALEEHLHSRP